MFRGVAIFIVVLGLTGFAVYFTLPGGKEDVKRQKEYFFARTVQMVSPPYTAVQRGTERRIPRMLDRIEWGTSRAVNWTIECLVASSDRSFIPEVIRRINLYKTSQHGKAKRYIDLLAELDEEDTLPVLIDCTYEPSRMVHSAALKGVGRFETSAATECLLRLAGSGSLEMKKRSMELLVERKDPEVLAFFDEIMEGSDQESLPFAMRALTAKGGEDNIERIRPYLDHEDYNIRSIALQSLLQMGDPSAVLKLNETLEHPGRVIKGNAINMIYYSSALPSRAVLLKLARDDDEDVRSQFVGILTAMVARHDGDELATLQEVLEILKDDERPGIRLKAIEGLYLSGRREVATPFLKKVHEAFGNELKEAITYLAELVEDQDAGPHLVDRFRNDPGLSFKDRAAILEGLANLGYSEAAGLFFEVIQGKWTTEEPVETPFTLDRIAAFKVHGLGGDIMSHWLGLMEKDGSDNEAYLFINGVRNLENSRAADALIELASDQERPLLLRKEAIMSFAFLRNLEMGGKLLQYSERELNSELAEAAVKVFWNYF